MTYSLDKRALKAVTGTFMLSATEPLSGSHDREKTLKKIVRVNIPPKHTLPMNGHSVFLVLFLAIMVVIMSPIPANAGGIVVPYSYGGEKIIKVADFPRTDDFHLNGGEHVDVGYRYKQFYMFWVPVWNYDGEWCGYINSEEYVDIPKSKLEEAAAVANITLPSEFTLPIGPTLGVRIFLGGMLLLGIWDWVSKKRKPASNTPTHRDSDKTKSQNSSNYNEEMTAYRGGSWILLVACVAKFAKLEGAISQKQIAAIEIIFRELGYEGAVRQHAIEVFRLAKDGEMNFSRCVVLFQELYHHDYEAIVALIVSLFKVAHINGKLTNNARHALMNTCNVLNCDYEVFLKFYESNNDCEDQTDLDEAYNVLGCSPSDSVKIIKERYRKLVKNYHPDTIASKELPEEFTKFAEEKFNLIQEAYQAIINARSK